VALSMNALAYGAVVLAGITLGLIGGPGEHPQPLAAPASAAAPAPETAPAASVATGGGVTLNSLKLEFPDSDRTFPGGAAADAINNNCLACHSAGMVLTQPRLPRSAWQAEVDKMRVAYKAPVAAEDVSAIVDYLANLNGGE